MAKKNNKTRQAIKYVLTDWFCALIAWTMFFFFRKHNEDPEFFEHYQLVFQDTNFIIGIICVIGGIYFIINPTNTFSDIVYMIGMIFLIFGVTKLVAIIINGN